MDSYRRASRTATSRAPQGARGLKCEGSGLYDVAAVSCPARGTWIEIGRYAVALEYACRAPQGARGLKCGRRHGNSRHLQSCPARGTWIEIPRRLAEMQRGRGRAPQGARGLKYTAYAHLEGLASRAPQGARGLKSTHPQRAGDRLPVVPRKGHVD